MGYNIIEKIVQKASKKKSKTGDIIFCDVDLLMAHDSSSIRVWKKMIDEDKIKIWDKNKVVIISDHFFPATDAGTANIVLETKKFTKKQKIKHAYFNSGVCHNVLKDSLMLRPGLFACGGDSHSGSGGIFGCYMAGYGARDTLAILLTGTTWIRMPKVIKVNLENYLQKHIMAKDIVLYLCKKFPKKKDDTIIIFSGDVVKKMSIDERFVLTNMAVEIGFETGIIEPDEKLKQFIQENNGEVYDDFFSYNSDKDAQFDKEYTIDCSLIDTAYISLPHNPKNVKEITLLSDPITINQCYIGGCTGGKYEDLHVAAAYLKGKKIHKDIKFLIAPATKKVLEQIIQSGDLTTLLDAGATLLPYGCQACGGTGIGILADDDNCISSTNRNFLGRMGNNKSSVYLASPYTVAVIAVSGEVSPKCYKKNIGGNHE